MPSLLSGYEYDIFISYRHNDNRSDWVTEFVNALQEELASTIKEPLSIYFDKNPHDGILDTHNVDKSLEGKLRCLIFIPITSQTYCDTKSFAWQHEFCAFNRLSKEDELGSDIKLGNGNVTSRILPVKIHDLDAEDTRTIESEIGGVLRAIEFIHKSGGVNRPLNAKDDEVRTPGKILYRDQVNKVANAIKGIISAVKNPNQSPKPNAQYSNAQHLTQKYPRKKLLISTLLFLILASALYYFYSKQPATNKHQLVLDKSIAVLPFVNLSNDPTQEYFSDGVMEEILTHLFKIGDLKVTSRTSVMGYKSSSKKVTEIAKELNVAHILEGSVQKYGDKVRITVQLIDAKNDKHIWAERYDRELKDVFAIQSEVAKHIAGALMVNLSDELQQRIQANPTSNTDAYDLFLKGRKQIDLYYLNFELSYVYQGIDYLNKAIAIDSNYSNAHEGLAKAYWVLAQFSPHSGLTFWKDSRKYALKAIELDPNNGMAYANLANVQYKKEWDKEAAYRSYQNALRLEPANLYIHWNALAFYSRSSDCISLKKEYDVLRSMGGEKPPSEDYRLALCLDQPEAMRSVEASGNHKAMILMHQGKFEEAIEFLEEQKRTTPYNIENRSALGEAYAITGNMAMAEQTVKELNSLAGVRNISKVHIASIYLAMGNERKAYQLLEQALEENDFHLHAMVEFHISIYRARNDPRMVSIVERSWIPRKIVN
jgi:TolB-like protein/Flp pilus assembly protein TadD